MSRLTSFQKVELVQKYLTGNYNCPQLAVHYNISRSAIYTMLKRKGVRINNDQSKLQRKYSLDETYFNEINTEAKSYFLGLLYADGCNFPDRNSISIGLQEKDIDILYKFKKELKCDKPLYVNKLNNKNKNWQNSIRLQLNSSILSKRLIELGCVPAKSLILKFPNSNQVSDTLLNHFIRGYLDGDGCICLSTKENYKSSIVNIVSTLDFCTKYKELLEKKLGIYVYVRSNEKSLSSDNKITKTASIGGNVQVKVFLDWLYKDATVFLKRKYDKYLELCSWPQNIYPKCRLRYNA